MSPFLTKISQKIMVLTVVGLGFLVLSCVSDNYQATKWADADIEELKDLWLKSSSHNARKNIVVELEKRKAVDALIYCHSFALFNYKRPGGGDVWGRFPVEDSIVIVNALGRLKDPKAIDSIAKASRLTKDGTNKELKLAILKAYQEINNPRAVEPARKFLSDPDVEIRWYAIDTLGTIKTSHSMQAIIPLLFDDEPDIRWKAVHALAQIGNPEAAGQISLLLADSDELVRGIAENVLKKLSIPEEKITEWKNKAGQLSIEDVYRSKLAHQRAEIEKQELAKELESEKREQERLSPYAAAQVGRK